MKRGRNQRRRQGANPNRALDSNGPEVRIRGTAQQIYDKYLTLARDASSAGDRVKAENYLQHAEHYFRVLRAMQPTQQPQQDNGSDVDADGDQPSVSESRDARGGRKSNGGADDSDNAEDDAPPAAAKRAKADNAAPAAKDDAAKGEADKDEKAAAADDETRKTRRRRPRRQTRDEASADADSASETAAAS